MTAGAGQVGTRERLLDAAIRLFARQGYAETSIADMRRAAMLIWDGIQENSPLLRVIFREPAFPELADELWSAITENAYRGFASGLRVVVDAGMMRIDDPDATAAVLVASLAYYPMVGLLIGHTPGDIDRDRYLQAWISHARAGLDYLR
jgi:AcrR family transcriptional regulator